MPVGYSFMQAVREAIWMARRENYEDERLSVYFNPLGIFLYRSAHQHAPMPSIVEGADVEPLRFGHIWRSPAEVFIGGTLYAVVEKIHAD